MKQLLVLSVVLLSAASIAGATTLSADALFTFSGGNTLTIVLTNTGAAGSSDVPGNILTGVFFNITGDPNPLTPKSATVTSGSAIVNVNAGHEPCDAGACSTTNVSGEWGYQHSASGFSGGPSARNGISSSGYITDGLAGNIGNFNNGAAGLDLNSNSGGGLDGIDFGIIANGTFTPNGGADRPQIKDSVTFVLTGVFTGLTGASISNVVFTYGTAFGENSLDGSCTVAGDCGGSGQSTVPEPASIILFGTMLSLTVYATRRRWRVLP